MDVGRPLRTVMVEPIADPVPRSDRAGSGPAPLHPQDAAARPTPPIPTARVPDSHVHVPGTRLARAWHVPGQGVAADAAGGRSRGGLPVLERVRAGNDLEDLLGDLGLAGPVHVERKSVDQLLGVLRGVAHRGHAGAELRGG